MTAPSAQADVPPARFARRTVVCVLGGVLAWCDVLLPVAALALGVSDRFFPVPPDASGAGVMACGLAASLAARPVGGVLFGRLGDRRGRAPAFVASLMLMGWATLLMALLPAEAGLVLPAFLALRALQGAAIGGVGAAGALMISESAPTARRGLTAAISAFGPVGGSMLALALCGLADLPQARLWGELRLASYLTSAGLFLVCVLLHGRKRAEPVAPPRPGPALTLLRRHWRELLWASGLRLAETGAVCVFLVFALVHGLAIGVGEDVLLGWTIGALVVELAALVLFGGLSDLIGRRGVCFIGAAGMLAAAFPIFSLIETREPGPIALALLLGAGLCHAAMAGAQPAFLVELFPAEIRGLALGLVHGAADGLVGGLALLVTATTLVSREVSWPMSLLAMALAALAILALLYAREPLADTAPYASSSGVSFNA